MAHRRMLLSFVVGVFQTAFAASWAIADSLPSFVPVAAPQPLMVIEQHRASVVQRIVGDWTDTLAALPADRRLTPQQLTEALWTLRSDRLLAASLAGSFAAIESILAEDRSERTSAQRVAAKSLGDADADLTYTPINPCRIADTRVAGGALAPSVPRTFDGFSANFSTQGGTATNCGMPSGVAAIAMNVYAVNPTNLGFIKVWPANGAEPAVSTVNYQVGITAIATGAIVPVDGVNNNRFIAKSPAQVDLIADVVGYFRAPGAPIGTVTAVTASAPLASSGGTTPDVSLTGSVPVANGGTGQASLTNNGVLIGQGTSGVTSAVGTAGQLLIGTVGAPTWSSNVVLGGSLNLLPTFVPPGTLPNVLLFVQTSVTATGFTNPRAIRAVSTSAPLGGIQAPPLPTAVEGNSDTGFGVYGSTSGQAGVFGVSDNVNGSGVEGSGAGLNAAGVFGHNSNGHGVWGRSFAGGAGTFGEALYAGGKGVLGVANVASAVGVYGQADPSTSIAVYGTSANGQGVFGSGALIGVQGVATGGNVNREAIRGENFGSATGYAGVFNGNVSVQGTLNKTAGSFKIDDPLDPANKYLSHSFVESPDMKNIYDGIVVTDSNGDATVQLPEWFQALNQEFRYQLTMIGQFAQAMVVEEIGANGTANRFSIRTDRPSVKVSWQVTGIRHDPYANEHRIPVVEDKTSEERGMYVYPQGYGLTQTSSVGQLGASARPDTR